MKPEDAQKEIDKMVAIYRSIFPHCSGFLVGSSLLNNKDGDSARFWKLKDIIDKSEKHELV
jgi:hypothetical protein